MQPQQNEADQMDAKRRFVLLCESLPVGLLVVDDAGIIQLTNRKTTRLFNINSEDWVGKSLLDLFEPTKNSNFSDFQEHVKSRGGCIELDSKSALGAGIPIELSLTDFPVGANKLLLATAMDITERREFQRFKQELIAMVSHDMASPLGSVQLALEFISSKSLEELTHEDLKMLKKAERSVGHLVKLVDDLLTVERLESGKIDLIPQLFDASIMLKEAADLMQDLADAKGITFEMEQSGDAQMFGDEGRLKQVVINFLSNAIKFSPEDGLINLAVTDLGTSLHVSVSDQGRGVPKAEQEMIFQRFHQVERDDARQKGGRGLGLAICKALVEGHNGDIGVISHNGMGSSFWFTIPHRTDADK